MPKRRSVAGKVKEEEQGELLDFKPQVGTTLTRRNAASGSDAVNLDATEQLETRVFASDDDELSSVSGDEEDFSESEDEKGSIDISDNADGKSSSSFEDDDDSDLLKESSSDEDEGVASASGGTSSFQRYNDRSIDTYDSSDEEDLRNTIGNIPVSWYDDSEHVGYDWSGKKVQKPAINKSEIDQFLQRVEDPNYWRKVRDKQTGGEIVLTDEQVDTLLNARRGRYPTVGYNPYQPFIDYASSQKEIHPISNRPEHKRSFVPSASERKMVGRMVHAIKMGWIKPKKPKPTEEELEKTRYYDVWADEDDQGHKTKSEMARIRMHFPAPKMCLPGHDESYNPPPEYLLTEEEKKRWEEQEEDERRRDFVPEKYASMREVPGYSRFIHNRFERCLDLYLAPRMRKEKLNVDPKNLLPDLPKPQDLQPFPRTLALGMVRSVAVEPNVGQLMASGGQDGAVRVWDISNGRCLKTFALSSDCPVTFVAWCPNDKLSLVAAVCGSSLYLLNTECGDRLVVSNTDATLKNACESSDSLNVEHNSVTWSVLDELENKSCPVIHLKLTFVKDLKQITWHHKGDYFATVTADDSARSVVVHQLSKLKSQTPFQKSKGSVQCVAFHTTRSTFFVATQKHIRVYNLSKLQLEKKLMSNSRWISSIAVHPRGDNVIVGGYDCRLSWFDLDLSTKPYKTFKHHKSAIRSVCFHPHYPLFASASDDGSVVVYHGRVYNDLLQNPQIVPVKVLRGQKPSNGHCVLSATFHPKQPWIITAGADGTIALYIY